MQEDSQLLVQLTTQMPKVRLLKTLCLDIETHHF